MKKLLFAVLGMIFMALSGQEFDRSFLDGLKFTTFYPVPMETCGLYYPGEKPQQVIGIMNTGRKAAKVTIKLKVIDYWGKVLEKKELNTLAPVGKQHLLQPFFRLPEKCGYYTIEAELFSGGKKYAQKQSSFVVLLPYQGRRDPFLGVNVVSTTYGKLPGLARLGYGTLEFGVYPFRYMDAYPWIYTTPQVRIKKKCPESFIDWFAYYRNVDEYLKAGFKVIGHLGVDIPQLPIRKKRIRENLFAATDEDLKINAVFGELAASRFKGKIKMWVLGQEVDAHAMMPEPDCGFTLAQLTDYVLRVKQAASGIRKGNPNAKITIMPSMGYDWSRNNPKFLYSRMIMRDLGDVFDYYGADVYVNAGNALRGRLIPPETNDAYVKYFKEAAELAKSFNRPGLVFNNERGYGVLYYDKLDCETNRQQGLYTARSVILARVTNVCPYYSVHMSCIQSFADREKRNLLKKGKYSDYSLWKGIIAASRAYSVFAKVPRPAVALLAVAARELSFVKKGVLRKFGDEIYSCSFDAPDGKQLIALWSTKIFSGVDSIATVKLDQDVIVNDGWGNLSRVQAGKILKLRLTEVPVYLRFSGDASKSEKLLKSTEYRMDAMLRMTGRRIDSRRIRLQCNSPFPAAVKGDIVYAGRKETITIRPGVSFVDILSGTDKRSAELLLQGRKINVPVDPSVISVRRLASAAVFGKWFSKATRIELKPQESVYPEIARMAEAGYFKMDGTDRAVNFYFAHDGKYLYVGARTPDVKHVQRFRGKDLWRDDSLQIAFSPRLDFVSSTVAKSSLKNQFSRKEHNIGIALCSSKSVIYQYGPVKKHLDWKVRVTRSGNETIYEAAFPLKELGISPRKGDGFLASSVIFNNDTVANKYAPYHYSLGRGVALGQNISLFKTFIME